MTAPRFHTPTGLADLVRSAAAAKGEAQRLERLAVVCRAVLEYEAYTEQQVWSTETAP